MHMLRSCPQIFIIVLIMAYMKDFSIKTCDRSQSESVSVMKKFFQRNFFRVIAKSRKGEGEGNN